jgi:hypothetical protein
MTDRTDLTELQAQMGLAADGELHLNINWRAVRIVLIIAGFIASPFVLPPQVFLVLAVVAYGIGYCLLQFLCSPFGLIMLAAMCGIPVVLAISIN